MLYPQNGDRFVTIDSVTPVHLMYIETIATIASELDDVTSDDAEIQRRETEQTEHRRCRHVTPTACTDVPSHTRVSQSVSH